MSTTACPCGSKLDYAACCQPFLSGVSIPDSPEALMRSRYTAFTQANADYLLDTWHPSKHNGLSADELRQSALSIDWQRLDILHSSEQREAGEGTVEFKAWYKTDAGLVALHERSRFVREDNRWFYLDGDIAPQAQRRKVGRNAPCPCGSGKKFKKCCG